jgi:hypothetical protein
MNENVITIYEKELKDAMWDLDYHTQKLEKAQVLIDLFSKKLEVIRAEAELLEDYTDVR